LRLKHCIDGICLKLVKEAGFLPDICTIAGGNLGKKLSSIDKKRGNRAEVRRERKKRDILSPVNVLSLSNR
jgi:hypothetical protein